jgi:hypothetical protein
LNRVCVLCLGRPGLLSSYLCYSCIWDNRRVPPHSAFYWLRWRLTVFLGWP